MKRISERIIYCLLIFFTGYSGSLGAQDTLQSITLAECYQLAQQNYPLVRQYNLINQSKDYSLANAKKGYLPQIHLAGQATYQSEVTEIPISLPQLNIPTLSKDQYRLYAEVSQSLTDLYTRHTQEQIIQANTEVENQKNKVDLYQLNERIDQLYFGILLIDAQIQQVQTLIGDIRTGMDKVNVAVANGVALKSSLDELKAAELTAGQKMTELKATRSGYTEMLSLFIANPISNTTQVIAPENIIPDKVNLRPELALFAARMQMLQAQSQIIQDKNLPRINLFVQGGLGKPGLNMLDDDLSPYYIAGLRAQWNLSNLYTRKVERQQVNLQQKQVNLQQDIFLFNSEIALRQQNSDISKLDDLIQTDQAIIALREKIRSTAQQQLTYGTLTTHDYLSYVYEVDKARQNLALHKLQRLMSLYKIKNTLGN